MYTTECVTLKPGNHAGPASVAGESVLVNVNDLDPPGAIVVPVWLNHSIPYSSPGVIPCVTGATHPGGETIPLGTAGRKLYSRGVSVHANQNVPICVSPVLFTVAVYV